MTGSARTRILLSGDEGPGTLAAVRGLHAGGYDVWLAVSQSDTYAARSRRLAGLLEVISPASDSEQHVRELADATASLGVRVVLPGTEGSLRAVTGREQAFPDGTAVGTCPPEVLQRATNKGLLTQLAREAGLEGPPSFALSARQDDFDNLPFPAVVKPMRTADDAGQRIRVSEVEAVANPAELRQLLDARPEDSEVLLQPQIDGTLAAICGVAWQGELVCAVHQRSPRIWPPNRGISAYAITTPPDREREDGVAALVRSLGWSGIFGVQFLLSD
ncbi:MAG: hypothetical protein ACRDNK_00155 [Solirubrobacteraceae bacterium]